MTNQTFSFVPSAAAVSTRRSALMGALALAATLFPLTAWGTDNPKLDADQNGKIVRLPPVPYLESMQWMNWKLSPPTFKIDTLLVPAGSPPGSLQLPAEDDRIRMS